MQNLHCFEEGDSIGAAEPYLFTIFFKIDGETISLTANGEGYFLEGIATIVGTTGNHGNLHVTSVGAGDDIPIPPEIGLFSTKLQKIPVKPPILGLEFIDASRLGYIVILMEDDGSRQSSIEAGYIALQETFKVELNKLIPTLGISKMNLEPEDIASLKASLRSAIKKAIIQDVFRNWLLLPVIAVGELFFQDEELGNANDDVSYSELVENPKHEIRHRIQDEVKMMTSTGIKTVINSDWEITGQITGIPYSLRSWLRLKDLDGSQGIRPIMSSLSVSTIKQLIEIP